MRNNSKKSKLLLIALLLFVSLGYALLESNLNITGTSSFARTTWNIHFENLVPTTNMTLSQGEGASITENKTTEVTYTLNFTEPGEYYEFLVDAKNDGTIDAMIYLISSTMKIGSNDPEIITNNNLPSYLDYSVTYSDNREIDEYHELKANEKETYKVRIEFKKDIEAGDLPGTNQSIIFTFGVEYRQKDDNSIVVPRSEFLTGSEVNVKMKQLAGDDTSSNGFRTKDTNITAIRLSDTEPIDANKSSNNIVSTTSSKVPIYMWYDNGIIYWWSKDKTPNLNADSSHMFRDLRSITDISGLTNLDTSLVTSFLSSFAYNGNLSNITPLANWNVENVVNMQTAFTGLPITNTNAFSKWKTNSLENLAGTFQNCTSLTSLQGVSNWNISKVTSLYITFGASPDNGNDKPMILEDLTPLRNWDTSSVTNLDALFEMCTELTTLSGLEKWDTSKVIYMRMTFGSLDDAPMKLSDISALKNWNVSKVELAMGAFQNCTHLTTIDDLSNWNVSSVTSFDYLFNSCTAITNASGINNWNISRTASFDRMFQNDSTHPTFTKVAGTWTSNGTFTPS